MNSPLRVVLGEWQTDEVFHCSITTPVEFIPAPTLRDADVVPLLENADVFLSKSFTAGMTSAAGSLRLIQTPGAGTNWIDFNAVPDHVIVCNVFGHEVSIAEYVFMSLLALNRDLLNMDARFRQADWSDRKSRPPGTEIRGRTLAVLGLGHIGREVARLGAAFGMRVLAITRSPSTERAREAGVDQCRGLNELQAVLAEADFVVVALPLDAGTAGIIGSAELGAMKRTAFLINVARGEVIDEAALYVALRQNWIRGAALDVWYHYPESLEAVRPASHPFHELSNVIMTPHIAGWTRETFHYRWAAIDDNLHRLSADEPLQNVVKPAKTPASETKGER